MPKNINPKEKKRAEKISKAENKAKEKALHKAKKIKQKASKASARAKQMARSYSKQREKEQKKVTSQSSIKREDSASYFASFIAELEQGAAQFKQGKNSVILTPSDQVDVSITAETKGRKEKVTFVISWITTHKQDLSISSC